MKELKKYSLLLLCVIMPAFYYFSTKKIFAEIEWEGGILAIFIILGIMITGSTISIVYLAINNIKN